MNAITTTAATSAAMSGEQLTAAIRHEHEAASKAAGVALQHALEAGRLLAEAKRKIRHGSWETYLRDSCDIAPRTARLYLRLHKHRDRLTDRQRVAEMSVRQAARLLERPKANAGEACTDRTKAEYWAPKIHAAWARAIEGKEAGVSRIADILHNETMSPEDRRQGERMLGEAAGELAQMKAGCSPTYRGAEAGEPEAIEDSGGEATTATAGDQHPLGMKILSICAEADYLHSCLRTIAAALPESKRQAVAEFVSEQAEKVSALRRKVEQGATA